MCKVFSGLYSPDNLSLSSEAGLQKTLEGQDLLDSHNSPEIGAWPGPRPQPYPPPPTPPALEEPF